MLNAQSELRTHNYSDTTYHIFTLTSNSNVYTRGEETVKFGRPLPVQAPDLQKLRPVPARVLEARKSGLCTCSK